MKKYYVMLLVSGILITACSKVTAILPVEGEKSIVMQDDYYTSSVVYNQNIYQIDLPYADPIDSVMTKPVTLTEIDISGLTLKEFSDKPWNYILGSEQNEEGIVTISYRVNCSFKFDGFAVPVYFVINKAEIDGINLPCVYPEVEALPPEITFIGKIEDRDAGILTEKYLLTCSVKITSNGVSEISSTSQEIEDVYEEICLLPSVDPWEE